MKREREIERNRIRVEQREENMKREDEFNPKKRKKVRGERCEVHDSYTSESYSYNSSIDFLLLKGHSKRQHRKKTAMEEKKKKSIAKNNEFQMLAKRFVSMRKKCHRLECVSFLVIVRDLTGMEGKQIVLGKDIATQIRVCQKIKYMGI